MYIFCAIDLKKNFIFRRFWIKEMWNILISISENQSTSNHRLLWNKKMCKR